DVQLVAGKLAFDCAIPAIYCDSSGCWIHQSSNGARDPASLRQDVFMTRRVARWWLCSVLAMGLLGLPAVVPVAAEPADQLALAEDLKSEALAALRQGKFDQSTDLLVRAADLSKDPVTVQMAQWVRQF